MKERREVIDCLGKDTGPVYGIDGTQPVLSVKWLVSEKSFHYILIESIIKVVADEGESKGAIPDSHQMCL